MTPPFSIGLGIDLTRPPSEGESDTALLIEYEADELIEYEESEILEY